MKAVRVETVKALRLLSNCVKALIAFFQGMSLCDVQVPLAKSSSSCCALTAAGAEEGLDELGELELVS